MEAVVSAASEVAETVAVAKKAVEDAVVVVKRGVVVIANEWREPRVAKLALNRVAALKGRARMEKPKRVPRTVDVLRDNKVDVMAEVAVGSVARGTRPENNGAEVAEARIRARPVATVIDIHARKAEKNTRPKAIARRVRILIRKLRLRRQSVKRSAAFSNASSAVKHGALVARERATWFTFPFGI